MGYLFIITYKLLGFTTLLNFLGHERRFRHRAWKCWLILLRGSNFGLRFFYVPYIYDTGPTASLPFRRKSYSGFLRSEKINRPRPGSNPRTSDPEASMITPRLPGSTKHASETITSEEVFLMIKVTYKCASTIWIDIKWSKDVINGNSCFNAYYRP